MYKKINNWWICRPVLKLHVAFFLMNIPEQAHIYWRLRKPCLFSFVYILNIWLNSTTVKWIYPKKLALQNYMSKGIFDPYKVFGVFGHSCCRCIFFLMKIREQAHMYWRLRKPCSFSFVYILNIWLNSTTVKWIYPKKLSCKIICLKEF